MPLNLQELDTMESNDSILPQDRNLSLKGSILAGIPWGSSHGRRKSLFLPVWIWKSTTIIFAIAYIYTILKPPVYNSQTGPNGIFGLFDSGFRTEFGKNTRFQGFR